MSEADQPGRSGLRMARQLVAYANFLRWSATFSKEAVQRHPQQPQLMMLSPMQSGRFAFAISGDTILLGVQSFEAAWLSPLPVDRVSVSDRLYLTVDGVEGTAGRLAPLGIGIFVDDARKRQAMAAASRLQLVRITVADGAVASVGALLGTSVAVSAGSTAPLMAGRGTGQDISRFF